MAHSRSDNDESNERLVDAMNRRKVMAAMGAISIPTVAGCAGGNGDDDDGDGDDDSNGDNGTNGENGTNGDGSDIDRHDVTLEFFGDPPIPEDVQWNPFGPTLPNFTTGRYARHDLANRSFYDGQIYGDMVAEWEYQPGLLTFTLHDDFYFWDGSNVTADTFLKHERLLDYHDGGDDLNYEEDIVGREKVDDYTVQLSLADTYNEDYALQITLHNYDIMASEPWMDEWLGRFEDAEEEGLDAIEEVREDLAEHQENEPQYFCNVPFEITGAQEDHFELELRTDDRIDHPEPHHVDQVNYTSVRWYTVEETGPRWQQSFQDGDSPFFGPAASGNYVEEENLDFEVEDYITTLDSDAGRLVFNCSFDNWRDPHLRRAIAYLCNYETFEESRGTQPRTTTSPFLSDEREENFVSEDVRESFTDYGWNESRPEDARAEMEAGGFEQDGDGNWLFKEGDQAGEPIEVDFLAWEYNAFFEEQGGQFLDDLNDFGIQADIVLDNDELWAQFIDAEFDANFASHGGPIPELSLQYVYDDTNFGNQGNPQIPETVEAPPVGEPAGPGEADAFTETYEPGADFDRLLTTTNEEMYQNIVDELAWIANQITPILPVRSNAFGYQINTDLVTLTPMEDDPDGHVELPTRRLWNNGSMQYNAD